MAKRVVKPKRRCCKSKPRCKRCPVVCKRLEKKGLAERLELRQYLVAGNNEERPFTRDQRRWVYASAKLENNYFGFGTDNDVEHRSGYVIVKHKTFTGEAPTGAHEDMTEPPSAQAEPRESADTVIAAPTAGVSAGTADPTETVAC